MPDIFRTLLFLVAGALPLLAAAEPADALFSLIAFDSEDRTLDFSSLHGKPLLVNFWAPWCRPCLKEIPDLVDMDTIYREQGIVILGMAIEETQRRETVRDFTKRHGVNYRVVLPGTSKGVDLMTALGNNKSALPFTVIIDRGGKIVTTKLGAMSKAEMEAAIETALK